MQPACNFRNELQLCRLRHVCCKSVKVVFMVLFEHGRNTSPAVRKTKGGLKAVGMQPTAADSAALKA